MKGRRCRWRIRYDLRLDILCVADDNRKSMTPAFKSRVIRENSLRSCQHEETFFLTLFNFLIFEQNQIQRQHQILLNFSVDNGAQTLALLGQPSHVHVHDDAVMYVMHACYIRATILYVYIVQSASGGLARRAH